MKVSIIIPVYNVSQYIVRCLDSVSAQTFSDMECLLINDCSTDYSISRAEQYIQDYTGPIRFNIIHHDHNQGQSCARNTGIRAAIGDYIYFMDSDDAITPDCIETLYKLVHKYPDADFAQGNTIKGTGYLETHHFQKEMPEYVNIKEELYEAVLSSTVTTVWNRLIKRSFIIQNSLFFPDGISNGEDLYWLYFMSKHVKAAAFTNRGTYFYYINANSSTTSRSKAYAKKRVEWHLITTQAIFNDMTRTKEKIEPIRVQYLAGFCVNCMYQFCICHSLRHWLTFWKLSYRIWSELLSHSRGRHFFFICTMPPLCFLTGLKAYRWRLRHYIVSKL